MDANPPLPAPRAVEAGRVIAWYAEGMRLWKLAPATFCTLGLASILVEFALAFIPEAGALAAKIVAPLVACGMLYASDAAARGERPRLSHALAAFFAPAAAVGAIVASSLVTFAAEAWAADAIGGVNLFRPQSATNAVDATTVLGIYAVGILASLPLSFVPLVALLGPAGFAESFRASLRAFALNATPLLIYGALAFVLIGFGLMTMGIGLVLVLPLLATSSYAAWRDVFPRSA